MKMDQKGKEDGKGENTVHWYITTKNGHALKTIFFLNNNKKHASRLIFFNEKK